MRCFVRRGSINKG
ncbi:MAG: hypothetical protein EPN89_09975 [Methylovulum sp.]|nr:MAG: hypothetical protein EPN89_09975 [Methylovulum sp.]